MNNDDDFLNELEEAGEKLPDVSQTLPKHETPKHSPSTDNFDEEQLKNLLSSGGPDDEMMKKLLSMMGTGEMPDFSKLGEPGDMKDLPDIGKMEEMFKEVFKDMPMGSNQSSDNPFFNMPNSSNLNIDDLLKEFNNPKFMEELTNCKELLDMLNSDEMKDVQDMNKQIKVLLPLLIKNKNLKKPIESIKQRLLDYNEKKGNESNNLEEEKINLCLCQLEVILDELENEKPNEELIVQCFSEIHELEMPPEIINIGENDLLTEGLFK